MEIEIKGHSGCHVDIIKNNNELFIEKSTHDKNYFKRLLLQAKKQIEASKIEYQNIRIPDIYNISQNDDSVIILMEYIYSRNYIEHFENSGFEQIQYFIKAICLFIEYEISKSPLKMVDLNIFFDKYSTVKDVILKNKLITESFDITKLISKIDIEYSKITELNIPVGICHGDLTFSNILFNGNNYFLIDFLDSFIETPLMDVVKIRQDSCFKWSQLMYVKPYDKIRLEIISQKIDDEINNYFKKYNWYTKYYKVFQIMNLLRVLQYAKDKKIIDYLEKSLGDILDD